MRSLITLLIALIIAGVAVYGINVFRTNSKEARAQTYHLAQQKLCYEKGEKLKAENHDSDIDYVYADTEDRCVAQETRVVYSDKRSYEHYFIYDAFTSSEIARFGHTENFSLDGKDYPDNQKSCVAYNSASLKYFKRPGPVNCG